MSHCFPEEREPKQEKARAKAKVKKKEKEKVRTKPKVVANREAHQLRSLLDHHPEVPHLQEQKTKCHANHTPKMAYANDQITLPNADIGTHLFAHSNRKAREIAEKETNVIYSTLKSPPKNRKRSPLPHYHQPKTLKLNQKQKARPKAEWWLLG